MKCKFSGKKPLYERWDVTKAKFRLKRISSPLQDQSRLWSLLSYTFYLQGNFASRHTEMNLHYLCLRTDSQKSNPENANQRLNLQSKLLFSDEPVQLQLQHLH